MLETGDPAIKLFGKTISLPGNKEIAAFHGNSSRASANEESFDQTSDSPSTNLKENDAKGGGGEQTEEKESFHRIPTETKEKDGAPPLISEELTDSATFTRNNENTKTAHVEIEIAKINASMTEEAQIDVGDAQEKTTLKKPDKLLPCPRCNSMDTKFCYYNNYNVNQPRHFCKHCQRYWTAGGTMRNMAVGAGRRKNKNSALQYRHIIVSESLQTAQATAPDGIHHPALKPKGTILTFGSDAPPPCESMASALNLADKTKQNCTQNGVRRGGEVAEDKSKGSYVTASSSMEEGRGVGLPKQMMQNCHGFPPQIPFFPGPPPWPNPWNTPQWSSAVPPPGFCPTFPIPFYPTPTYWGSPVPGPWGVPWLPSPASAPNHGGLASTSASGPNSPTLGKHSREGDMLKPSISENKDPLKQSNSETSIWIPKTLRIDDPSEAAKSSIWTTLGIKRDKSDSSSSGGLLRPFESSSKSDEKSHMEETSKVLQANPAALSRSLNFHERW